MHNTIDKNIKEDKNYEKCDTSRITMKCKDDEMLCPMIKPRLDRYYGDDLQDVYYYIDYDCIQCVPIIENCSKCSPGVWCEGLGRCVGSGLMSKSTNNTSIVILCQLYNGYCCYFD